MRISGMFAKLGALVLVGTMSIAGAAQAATITIDFSGVTTFNPGLLGAGSFAGSITYDTDCSDKFRRRTI